MSHPIAFAILVILVIIGWELSKVVFWVLGQLFGPALNTLYGDWADRNGIRLRDWFERKMRERRRMP